MKNSTNELLVISKSKELCDVVFEITSRSPKQYRASIVSRMQNISLDVISKINQANDMKIDLQYTMDLNARLELLKKQEKDCKDDVSLLILNQKLMILGLERTRTRRRRIEKRMDLSYSALTSLRELDYLIVLAEKRQCITNKQRNRLAALLFEVRRLLVGYIRADKERYKY